MVTATDCAAQKATTTTTVNGEQEQAIATSWPSSADDPRTDLAYLERRPTWFIRHDKGAENSPERLVDRRVAINRGATRDPYQDHGDSSFEKTYGSASSVAVDA